MGSGKADCKPFELAVLAAFAGFCDPFAEVGVDGVEPAGLGGIGSGAWPGFARTDTEDAGTRPGRTWFDSLAAVRSQGAVASAVCQRPEHGPRSSRPSNSDGRRQ